MLLPQVDPDNRVRLIEWAVDSAGENKTLFPQPLILDYEALKEFEPQPAPQGGGGLAPMSDKY
jgi:hypothetical protein